MAKTGNDRFYKTGKPCKNGHISKRYVSSGRCAACAVAATLKYQAKAPEHPNRVAARASGEVHYSTGSTCAHGHDRRFVSNGICVECDVARNRRYHAARPGREASWARVRRAKDPAGHRKSSLKWAAENRDKANAIRDRCFARNPEAWRKRQVVYVQNRNARKRENGGAFTVDDIERLRVLQKDRCAGCGRRRKLEVDHIRAVINGGTNNPKNLQLLCGPCNKSKGKKDAIIWAQQHGRLL